MNDATLAALQSRLDATQIELDKAIIARLINEPWRISETLYGQRCWPPYPWEETTDTLAFAEGECRWRVALYGYRRHPRVHQVELCVDALLRMLAD
jgi:hypothetical protein